MAYRIARILTVVLVAAALVLPPPIVEACGPDFSGPTFSDYSSPDAPLEAYARGKLGLIQPGYQHIYLYAAYRNLVGKSLSNGEMKDIGGIKPEPDTQEQASSDEQANNWVEIWKEARKRVSGESATTNLGTSDEAGFFRWEQKNGLYLEYYNCLQGAFQNAVAVLDERIKEFGSQSPYVSEWVDAQDEVFENCSSGVFAIPNAASPSEPQLIRDDRAYQIAAAHFYSGDFEDAQAEFTAIAKEPASPYHQIAPYLVARTLVREATLNAGNEEYDAQPLTQAERLLEAILADKNLSQSHHAARGLLGFVRIRLHPEQRAKDLETVLLSDKANPDFRQNLTDYLWLLDHSISGPIKSASPAATTAGQAQAPRPGARLEGEDMTDWIFSFQGVGPDAFQHSLMRWQETKSLPWLVAAISQANGSDAGSKDLEAAALRVSPDSPGYVTATFNRLRLLAEAGHASEARLGLDSVLSNKTLGLTLSARNEFLALRMKLSTNLSDFLRYAPRVPSNMGGYLDSSTNQTQTARRQSLFDSDASLVLTEELPLQLLAAAARSSTWPVALRKEVAIAAWTRAILLNDETVARETTPILAEAAPQLKVPLAEYGSAKTSGERRFAAVFLILHFPGMRPFVAAGLARSSFNGPEQLGDIDSYRDNWWCPMGPPSKNAPLSTNFYSMYVNLSGPLRDIYPKGKIPPPDFLTENERTAVGKESAMLRALPCAPSWLAQQTLVWAKVHPEDPRIPEALHLVVRTTRYGCPDLASAEYSKEAFTLLHSRYRHNEWAKKTPFWFN